MIVTDNTLKPQIMIIESLPTFTPPAATLWKAISDDIRKKILSNVWCTHCQSGTTITNFSGAVKDGDLLLVGRCAVCHKDVARIIETG
jgi:hypothetical protein